MSHPQFDTIISEALFLMETGLEPRSALKEAASTAGVSYGKQMALFIAYAEAKLFS